jgi:ribose transport system permease protein
MPSSRPTLASRLFTDYGMVLVLLALCVYYSAATVDDQHPTGAAAGEELAREALRNTAAGARVLVVAGATPEEAKFASAAEAVLREQGARVEVARGQPIDARRALDRRAAAGDGPAAIVASQVAASWSVLQDVGRRYPALRDVRVLAPVSYRWPNFLKRDNLINVANQIAVIAILAVGMTLVVIAGGIDLSVGSLVALSAVAAALLIRDFAGAEGAGPLGMALCCLAAVAVCGLVGGFNGIMVTACAVPPFIATLAMMLIARGLANRLSGGQSVYQVPDAFVWLGRGADLAGVPNAVVLMLLLYAAAHVLMTRTTLGRYIYAVGGNAEAARLSGVPVRRVLLAVYCLSGALAGLGGVVTASQLKSGSPTYGLMYELYVIAAVAVGGTSLAGGEGRVFGTLTGALIIAVIQNGMNLTGVESYTQQVVLGAVLLGAVLLDQLKRRGGGYWGSLVRYLRARGGRT